MVKGFSYLELNFVTWRQLGEVYMYEETAHKWIKLTKCQKNHHPFLQLIRYHSSTKKQAIRVLAPTSFGYVTVKIRTPNFKLFFKKVKKLQLYPPPPSQLRPTYCFFKFHYTVPMLQMWKWMKKWSTCVLFFFCFMFFVVFFPTQFQTVMIKNISKL